MDRVQAWLWLGLAAESGNAWAAQRQAEVERAISPGQLEQARSALEGWTEQANCRK